MDEKQFGSKITALRHEKKLTQEELAAKLHVSAQAVSKWENGHSLPETALLPELARILETTIDDLFHLNELIILEAIYGDGVENVNVTKRLSRFIEQDNLTLTISSALLDAQQSGGRVLYLTVKYRGAKGICYAAAKEGSRLTLSSQDNETFLNDEELEIIAGSYGTKNHHYDVMQKIEHYREFHWNTIEANHETFPSDPANDETEYLTLVYFNESGIHIASCAEGERLVYDDCRMNLSRCGKSGSFFLANVPKMPFFGDGQECSWASALTAALQYMGEKTDYDEVMGVSGACYRLAFCSPQWDYSSVDALVCFDYNTPGYTAFGYTPEMFCRTEKSERSAQRQRMLRELRNHMPILGINLRVAAEWGVICGYDKDGEVLYCRTKYDKPTIENDPKFMKNRPEFDKSTLGEYDYLPVDNWPFLFTYFTNKRKAPSARENLINSLKIFIDCSDITKDKGYFQGFQAYEVWAKDLCSNSFYSFSSNEKIARRFSVNQFCALSLKDARRSAYLYLQKYRAVIEDKRLETVTDCFRRVYEIAEDMHKLIDTDEYLEGSAAKKHWTKEMRYKQAEMLREMAGIEREAFILVSDILAAL